MKSLYEVQTFNDARESENRIHSDEVARQLGFKGALVSGVVVFGHMTYLPMKAEAANWLTNNEVEVRFLKPAYDGELLTIEHVPGDSGSETHCDNAEKTLITTMTSQPSERAPAPASAIAPAKKVASRVPIHWDNLYTDKPAAAYIWHADQETNLALTEQLFDDLAVYRDTNALVHPFWILRQCNAAFARSFILPAWIHVGSKIHCHKPLRVGEDIEVRMIPMTKWERKGHQFTTLHIPFLVNGEVRVEVEHTAIFRIAPPPE